MEKIVVTGLGAVTPIGNCVAELWQNLMAGKSGIDQITQFDASGFPTTIAAEVKNFDVYQSLKDPKHLLQYSYPALNFGLVAAQQALQDAQLRAAQFQHTPAFGMIVASGRFPLHYEYWEPVVKKYMNDDTQTVNLEKLCQDKNFFNVKDFVRVHSAESIALLASFFDIVGFTTGVNTACSSGGQAIGLALHQLRYTNTQALLVGGYDSMISPFGLTGFSLLTALSTDNQQPQKASRPFDKTRNGFVMGEGAGFMVLEKLSHAKARGARIYAELVGEGNSMSAYKITDSPPDGSGAFEAMHYALQDAQLLPENIGYINAHGTSTQSNDRSEAVAISRLFKHSPLVSSTKSLTGHLIAAAGVVEALISIKALQQRSTPLAYNLDMPDPECILNFVTANNQNTPITAVMSNCFGFGGSNSSVIFKRMDAVL